MKKTNIHFLLIPVFIILILNLGLVSASNDNLTLQDTDNNILEDEIICDNIDDSSNSETEDIEIYEKYENNLIDDSADPNFEDGKNKEPENRDISNEFDEEYLEYVEDIQNSTSESYYDFFCYLVNDCGFEFRNTSDVGDGYFLYATTNYTGTLFDGVEFTILSDEYYFVSTNSRLPYYVYNNYYEDIVYCHEDNYILDEEYLGWLIWDSYINNRDFSFGTNVDLNSSSIAEFLDYSSNMNRTGTRDVDLPSRYDLRDYGFVTPIKDQLNTNNCWAFATMAALESYLLKFENTSYNLSTSIDFSENNLKNVMSSRGRNGTDNEVNQGGNMYMALAYLLRWSGPVNETDDPYGNEYNISSEYLNPLKHVQCVEFIPNRTSPLDNDVIKEAIYNYGGIVISMYWDNNNPFLGYDGKSYKFQNMTNYAWNKKNWHSVTVVGWDDNYSKNNFALQPDNDGAFIIKNSWGESNGENGYYYVSYYDEFFGRKNDSSFVGFAFTNVGNLSNYDSNYNYNPLGLTDYGVANSSQVSFANQWVSEKNETLKACGLYIKEPCNCFVRVMVNGDYVEGYSYCQLDYPGFHTINLDQTVSIHQGDTYRVEVTLINQNSNYIHIPFEQKRENYSKASAEANQSFVYMNNNGTNEWVDLTTMFNETNICLHAFTEFVPNLIGTEIIANNLNAAYNDGYLNATLKDVNGNPIVGKRVAYYFNDKCYNRTSDSNGKVSLHIGAKPGSYTFEIRFLGDDNYYSSAKGVIVKVVKKATTVVCTMTSCYYNEKLNITLKDSNGNVLANKKVTFQFNNDHIYKRTTDSNGRASLPINLKNNTYHFTIRFLGDNCYSMSSKTVNLKVKKAPAKVTVPTYHVRYNSGIYFNVTVKNNKTNNPISGVKINLNVSAGNTYKYYNITTNASGIARINLSKLSVGTHQVIISSLNPSVVFAKITKTIKILSA